MVNRCNGILLGYKKKNKIMPSAATWMHLNIITLSEVKSEREKHIPHNITYMWNPKYDANEPVYKTDAWTHSTDSLLPRGRGRGWD